MSHSPPYNYMDGVPVKISERFKPPPKITLPQSVINRLNLVQQQHSQDGPSRFNLVYDFELEETVLKRTREWRAFREVQRSERNERIRLKEVAKTRLAEEEQKRKLNQICYPNTDELSSASEEEEVSEDNDESLPSGSSEERVQEQCTVASSVIPSLDNQYNYPNRYDSILVPTILPDTTARARVNNIENVNDSVVPVKFNIPKSTSVFNNNNGFNKINYSDFENDTSSPFDNMELKTINDLDILAQVLNLNVSTSGSERSPEENNESKPVSQNQASSLNVENKTEQSPTNPTTVGQQSFNQGQQPQYQTHPYQITTQQQPNPSANDYYNNLHPQYGNYGQQYAQISTSQAHNYPAQYSANFQAQAPQQSQYHLYNQPASNVSSTYNYFPYSTLYMNKPATTSVSSFYYQPRAEPVVTATTTTTTASGHPQQMNQIQQQDLSAAIGGMGSKSKSVPDIIRQLDEDVKNSALRRTRNNSQSSTAAGASGQKKYSDVSTTEPDFTQYNQLSLEEQNLAKRISSMGFPLERVVSVLKRLGNDDKKNT
ncbi:uncharacterized protein LOC129751823 isoform X2 [Uranotaenia lowii]|uniref:uncharacterized protein LOC129751823 isoform X2 n=1 Tax=Uranotaenia lowii TaxID=190385 RepID=UPI00247A1886|nr:uncharacterized protein LOC129751823 isoform X2 [Uranotaenia lowii]